MSKTLIEESIAELKELKKVAIQNAKLSFDETITPAIRAILESAIAEQTEEKEEEAPEEVVDEAKKEVPKEEEAAEEKPEEGEKEVDETFDIDAALAEIEGSVTESDDKDKDDEAAPEKTEDAPEKEVEVEGGEEDELDEDYINKLLAEVEEEEVEIEEGEKTPEEGAEGEEPEAVEEGAIEDILNKIKALPADLKKAWDEKYSPAAVKKAVAAGDKTGFSALAGNLEEKEEEAPEKEEEASEQALLESFKNELKAVNLLNSKLLFQNKLLLNESLSDAQKANVIKALDKATTVKEAKIVYEAYKGMGSAQKAPQTAITEKLGFKKIGVLQEAYKPANSYDPTDPVVAELQRRAGIKK